MSKVPTLVLADEKPIIDLAYMHFDHRVGPIRVIGTWMYRTKGNEHEGPCIVLAPANKSLTEVTPCIVPMVNAWLWAEETGDEVDAALMAMEFAEPLGMNPLNKNHVILIMSAVRSRLSDMLTLPPPPRKDKRVAGDITVLGSDGRVFQKEMKVDV